MHQPLTARSAQRGVPAKDKRTADGAALRPGCAVHDSDTGLGWHRDRPRLMLAGTVLNVKSVAQVSWHTQHASSCVNLSVLN